MIWTLQNLLLTVNSLSANINGKWVPARPINWKCMSIVERFKAARMVFTGKADAFTWPEGQ